MLRYVALMWDATDPVHTETQRQLCTELTGNAEQWRNLLQREGLIVFFSGETGSAPTYSTLAEGSGMILGTIFERRTTHSDSEPRALRQLDRCLNRRIVESGGRCLIDSHWGSYVAIVQDGHQRTSVLRSPMSSLACLYATFRGVHIVFSSLWDLPWPVLECNSLNWRFIARSMLKIDHGEETGFREVSEIRGGECLHVHSGRASRHIYWDCLQACEAEPIEDATQAAQLLRTTVRHCVKSWASCHPRILHRLSGGLDSSIVLACLDDRRSRSAVVCINRHSHGYDGDERSFARLAAEHAHCELIEMGRDSAFDFENLLRARGAERPQDYITQLGQYVPECEVARRLGATAVFCGDYGDQLFYGPLPILAISDYVHQHGIDRGILPVALNAARLKGLSVWQVLRQGVPQGLKRSRWDRSESYRKDNTLVADDVATALADATSDKCTWYDRGRYVPPGKQYHVSCLPSASGGYPPFERLGDPDYVPCLFSQPIVELCLRIPSYVLTRGGWDRATARDAFSNDLPSQIIRRRSKGGQGEYTLQVMRRNIPFVRELLIDGMLVKQGLLDRRKLEEALSGRPSKLLRGTVRLRRYLAIEVWMNLWGRRRNSAPHRNGAQSAA